MELYLTNPVSPFFDGLTLLANNVLAKSLQGTSETSCDVARYPKSIKIIPLLRTNTNHFAGAVHRSFSYTPYPYRLFLMDFLYDLDLLCAFLLYSSSIKGSAFTHFCVLGGGRAICLAINGLNSMGLCTLKFLFFNPKSQIPNRKPLIIVIGRFKMPFIALFASF